MQVNGAYNIRQTGNGIGSFIPKNSQPSYVGATVAWNQLAPLDASGWTLARASFSVSGTKITIEPTVTYTNILKWATIKINPSHKYFIRCKITAPTQAVFVGIWNDNSSNTYVIRTNAAAGETANVETIWDATANGNYFRIQMPTAAVTGDTGEVDKLVFTDLTLAFGSTIADYAYTLESGNAGDGIAWLQSQGFFLGSYYAYDAGSLQSVETEKANNTGFNLCDEDFELGSLSQGLPVPSTSHIRSKNYIPIVPSTTYFETFTTPGHIYVALYDGNQNFTRYINNGYAVTPNQFFTTEANECWFKILTHATYGADYKHDICINISTPGKNGTYEPYSPHQYTLGHATLRGCPYLSTDKILYDGDKYESSGKITRNYGIIDLGTITSWTVSGTNPSQHNAIISGIASNTDFIVSEKYVNDPANRSSASSMADGCMVVSSNRIYITSGSGVNPSGYLIYKKSSATTESSASFSSLMFAEAGGTEQLVDYAFNHGTRDVEIPVGTITDYGVIRFAGYLIAVRNSQNVFTPIPLEYMRYESYNVAPEQRLDLDSTRDTTGVLHRTVLAHTATKVTFNVPCMEAWRIQELLNYFRTAFKQTNGDTQAHKLELKYFDEWADDYKTGIMYMPDIQFQIRNIDRDARLINYQEIKITFIEY